MMVDGGEADRGRSQADKALFAAFLTVGCAAIIGLKFFGFSQLLVTIPAVMLIIVYAAIVSMLKFFRLREDRAGDNCYYLGFLFTLCSLAVALMQYYLGNRDTDELIGNFGIALFTTIVGIGCRVLLGQFREDPLDVEQEVRVELAEAASRFKSALDNSINELETFRHANQQSVEEGFTRQRTFFEEQSELFGAAIKEVTAGVSEVAGEFQSQANAFNDHVKRLVKVAGQLETKLNAVDIPEDLITRRFGALDLALAQMGEVLEEKATAEQRTTDQTLALLDRLVAISDQMLTRSTQLRSSLEGLPQAAEKFRAALDTEIELTSRHAQELAKSVEAGHASREEFQASTRANMEAVAAALEAWRRVVNEERQVMEGRRAAIEEENARLLAALTAHREAMQNQLEQSRGLVHQFEAGLVSVVDDITRRVDGGRPPYGQQ